MFGGGWKNAANFVEATGGIAVGAMYLDDYVKQIAASKICLGFMSRKNRNTAAGRTFEIPAIGSFFLGERTEDHMSYFEEGKEAEYFSSAEELVEKCRYYLRHDDKRGKIARAGHLRCLSSPYSYKDRMEAVINAVEREVLAKNGDNGREGPSPPLSG